MILRIGCCGFPMRRQKYFSKFGIVELQQTFYQPPKVEAARKWRAGAPDDFEFTLKAWQVITHPFSSPTYRRMKKKPKASASENYGYFRPTDEVFGAWEETERIAAAMRSRVIVFQCPPSFVASAENKNNLKRFFRTIKRKRYRFVWEVRADWPEKDIRRLCEELDLVHCVDPFTGRAVHGDIRYFRLHGRGGYNYRYTGMDLKKLRDFCENESYKVKRKPVYALFNNTYMKDSAERFGWIVKNTGRMRDVNLHILKDLCREIEAQEEDEKVQLLSREAERIVMLILHTDYQKVDIEIETAKLREMCRKLFPGKDHLFDMIYGQRFDRLWEQFREREE